MSTIDDWIAPATLFIDRRAAGRELAGLLEDERGGAAVVVGLARGGVIVAAEVAAALGLPLDAVAVRKVGHPWQPEYAIGAVAPGDGVYVRAHDGLSDEDVDAAVDRARKKAAELDGRLHAAHPALELSGRPCVLVDDGLATGATMVAAVRWARSRGSSRVVAAVPVGARESVGCVREEADAVLCPHELDVFVAVGAWYDVFGQVADEDVVELLADTRAASEAGNVTP